MSIAIQHFSMHGFYFNTRFLFQRGHGMLILRKMQQKRLLQNFAKGVLFTV
jgi:hypothetical protein